MFLSFEAHRVALAMGATWHEPSDDIHRLIAWTVKDGDVRSRPVCLAWHDQNSASLPVVVPGTEPILERWRALLHRKA